MVPSQLRGAGVTQAARPTGIKAAPDADGLHRIKVTADNGEEIEIGFNEAEAVHFVRVFQQAFLERRTQIAATPDYPTPAPTRFYVGHGRDGSSALLVDTAETGTLAFPLTPVLLDQLEAQVRLLREKQSQRVRN